MNNHDIMRRRLDEARTALEMWEFLAGDMVGLNPPLLSWATPGLGEPQHLIWYELCDKPWERMAEILRHFKSIPQATSTYWSRTWGLRDRKPGGIPHDKWIEVGNLVVHANKGEAELVAWVEVGTALIKVRLHSPLESMGVKARVMVGGYIEYTLNGWEKILEPDSGAYFYKPGIVGVAIVSGMEVLIGSDGHCPECGASAPLHLTTCSHTVIEPVRVSREAADGKA